MSRKLRVFISSTMKDLANERFAVRQRLLEFNFEPVNAEGWMPNGSKSWSKIEDEIQSSDLFILIMGGRYGWIPETGPKADTGLSVTHLEYKEAQAHDIPILPFLKRLDYDTDRSSDDAKKRDKFRNEVKAWDKGYLVSEFDLAPDLADKVGISIIGLLTDKFQKERIAARSSTATKSALLLTQEISQGEPVCIPPLPKQLIDAVRKKDAVLFAGAGISFTAGLPSASAFSQRLIQLVQEHDSNYSLSPAGSVFSGVAADLEALRNRKFLVDEVLNLIHPPQGMEPTSAHLQAVRLFDRIFTTNYDNLFEESIKIQNLNIPLIVEEIQGSVLPDRAIVKLHGSANKPDSLLITERDIYIFDRSRPFLWQATVDTFRKKMVIVVGSSLRDPSIVRLFSEVGDQLNGYFIAPYQWKFTQHRLHTWNLKCIETDANTFMNKLSKEVGELSEGKK